MYYENLKISLYKVNPNNSIMNLELIIEVNMNNKILVKRPTRKTDQTYK